MKVPLEPIEKDLTHPRFGDCPTLRRHLGAGQGAVPLRLPVRSQEQGEEVMSRISRIDNQIASKLRRADSIERRDGDRDQLDGEIWALQTERQELLEED